MAKTLEARVKQKKDTLENWNANPLVLLDGEQAFVVDEDGNGINFKIGDGTKTFAQLPWFNIVITGDKMVVVDNMAQMRSLPQSVITRLQSGQLSGVTLNGYYTKGDTPGAINYYLSTTSANDDGGSVIEVGGIKLEHKFIDELDVSYFGTIGDGLMDDSIKIQSAVNTGCANIRLTDDKIFLFKNGVKLNDLQRLYGNKSIIKRADESETTITVATDEFATSLTLDTIPSDWKVGDTVHVFKGVNGNDTTNQRKITAISGNVITLDVRIGKFIDGSSSISSGFGVRKVFNLVEGQQYPTPFRNKVEGITFDGNKDNNASNLYWYHNATLAIYGFGSVVEKCRFINISNECIVTHGSRIVNNTGDKLNGSFVHLSSPREELGETFQGCVISGNTVWNTNIIDPTITQHSNAVIEQSWNAGKLTIVNNQFSSANKFGWCYDFSKQSSSPDADSDLVIVANNLFIGYNKISNDISNFQTWDMNNRTIIGNIFKNCGTVNYSHLHLKKIIFELNDYVGDTVVQNLVINKPKTNFTNGIELQSSLFKNASGVGKVVFAVVGDFLYIQDAVTNKVYIRINTATGNINLPIDATVSDKKISTISVVTTGSSLTLAQLNTLYPSSTTPIGSEVILTTPSPPVVYKKLSETQWGTVSYTLVS